MIERGKALVYWRFRASMTLIDSFLNRVSQVRILAEGADLLFPLYSLVSGADLCQGSKIFERSSVMS